MKKIFIGFILLLFIPVLGVAQQRIVRLTRFDGAKITGVNVYSPFEVKIVQSDHTRAVVEIDEELESRLNFTLNGDGVVHISLKNGTNSRRRNPIMKITVYLPELHFIKTNFGATVTAEGNFRGSSVRIYQLGASSISNLNIDTEAFDLRVTQASNIQVNVKADRINMFGKEASNIRMQVDCGNGLFSLASASVMILSGEGENVELKATDSSKLDAQNLTASRVEAYASKASNLSVWAVNQLKANANGASRINYRGSPDSFQTNSSGASSIRKIN